MQCIALVLRSELNALLSLYIYISLKAIAKQDTMLRWKRHCELDAEIDQQRAKLGALYKVRPSKVHYSSDFLGV